MPRFNRLPRRASIIVLTLRSLILVRHQKLATAQPSPQVGMQLQYCGQLFVLRSTIADKARYQQPQQPAVVGPEGIDDLTKRLLFIKVCRDRFAHVLPACLEAGAGRSLVVRRTLIVDEQPGKRWGGWRRVPQPSLAC